MTKVYPSFVPPSIACEVFGVTSQTLRRWAKERKISFIKTPGGQYRYNVEGHIGALQAVPVVKTPKRHPDKVAPVEVRAAPTVAPVAKPAPVEPAPKVQAQPVEPPKPKLDAAALRHKIEALASASA